MIREPSFLKKKKLSQLPPWMECWGKLLCWVSLFCKKFIIDLMFCWTTLKKKNQLSLLCHEKQVLFSNACCTVSCGIAHGQLATGHWGLVMCQGTAQPHGLSGRGSATSHVTCPEVCLTGSARCHAAGARVRPGQVGKTLRKEEVVF